MYLPLEQGLRLEGLKYVLLLPRVKVYLPLEQGLRRFIGKSKFDHCLCQSVSTARTRIKTLNGKRFTFITPSQSVSTARTRIKTLVVFFFCFLVVGQSVSTARTRIKTAGISNTRIKTALSKCIYR